MLARHKDEPAFEIRLSLNVAIPINQAISFTRDDLNVTLYNLLAVIVTVLLRLLIQYFGWPQG